MGRNGLQRTREEERITTEARVLASGYERRI
jgi:hypothetical protein